MFPGLPASRTSTTSYGTNCCWQRRLRVGGEQSYREDTPSIGRAIVRLGASTCDHFMALVIRAQLNSVLAKMGVSRQAEVAGALASLPGLGPD